MPVYKDENRGTWYYALNYKNEQGKRKQTRKRGFKTKKAATEALRELEVQVNQGTYTRPSKILFSDYIQDWLEVRKTSIGSQTVVVYKNNLKNHILPLLGHIPLAQIKPIHIQNFLTAMHGKNLKGSTIKKAFNIVNACLNYAVKIGDLPSNVASKIESPKAAPKEMDVWNIEEIKQFLQKAKNHRLYYLFYLAIMTGLRQGELLGLRWQDVDLDKRVISIKQTLEHDGKAFKQGAKTKSSMRSVAISLSAKEILLKCKEMLDDEKDYFGISYTDLDLVMCTETGTPINPRNLLRTFKLLTEEADLPHIRFHDLRHTHAALMIFQNEPMKLIAERLGHSKITTTMDTYGHLLPNMQQDASDRLDQTIFGSSPPY